MVKPTANLSSDFSPRRHRGGYTLTPKSESGKGPLDRPLRMGYKKEASACIFMSL